MPPLPDDVRHRLHWLADGVALIPAPETGPGAASLLIEDGDVVLVDAGIAPEWQDALAPHVDVCILTHVHLGHVTGASAFRDVWAPKAEADALRGVDAYLDAHDVPPASRDVIQAALEDAGYAPVDHVKPYRPGGIIALDRYEWHLLPAPGHSPGHTALLDPERHILFSGDVDDSIHGPWYGYPTSDPDDFEVTAERLAGLEVALLVTSHTPPRRRGIRPALRGAAARIEERDRRVLGALKTPRSLDELVAQGGLTGRWPTTPLEEAAHRVMVEKHLLRLMERDHVAARQDGRYERLGYA